MILDTLAEATRKRIEGDKERISPERMESLAFGMDTDNSYPFERNLATDHLSFICECKKASPSKGLIAPVFPYLEIAKDYDAAGASAISVLTETDYFLGSDRYLEEIAREVSVPCLRKDFTIDEYMIHQAKVLGAKAILLIVAILDAPTIRRYLHVASQLGLSALVEAHDEREIEIAIECGARIIGVNNRNLKDFTVDISNSVRLRNLIPSGVLYVSESGVRGPEDIAALRDIHPDAVLVGEALMRAPYRQAALRAFKAAAW